MNYQTPNVVKRAIHHKLESSDVLELDNVPTFYSVKKNLVPQFKINSNVTHLKIREIDQSMSNNKVTSNFEIKSPSMSVPRERNGTNNYRRIEHNEHKIINSSYLNPQKPALYQINNGDLYSLRNGEHQRTISQNYSHNNQRYSTLEPETPTIKNFKKFELPDLSRRSERKKRKLPKSSAERKLPECFSVRSNNNDFSDDESSIQDHLYKKISNPSKFNNSRHLRETNTTLDSELRKVQSEKVSPRNKHRRENKHISLCMKYFMNKPAIQNINLNNIYSASKPNSNNFYLNQNNFGMNYHDNSRFASIINRGD